MIIASITPLRADRGGGEKITLTGTFDLTKTYTVTVGGVPAYSGVPGHGNVVVTLDGTTIAFVMPPLATPGAKTVGVTEHPGNAFASTSIDALERVFGSAEFAVRRMFPPWADTGPRRLDLETPE